MIDRENINRHLIVTKKDEKTKIANVTESNIVDEEVLYNALGYSIFESLQEKIFSSKGGATRLYSRQRSEIFQRIENSCKQAFEKIWCLPC